MDQLAIEDHWLGYFEAIEVESFSMEAEYQFSNRLSFNLQGYIKEYPKPPPFFDNYRDHLQLTPELAMCDSQISCVTCATSESVAPAQRPRHMYSPPVRVSASQRNAEVLNFNKRLDI